MSTMNPIHLALPLALTLTVTLEAQNISLDDARRQALEHSHQIAAARETTLMAQQQRRAMRTNYLPKLSGSAIALYAQPSKAKTFELGTIPLPESLASSLQTLAQSMPQLAPLLMQFAGGIPVPPISYQFKMGNSYYAALTLTQPIYMGGKITSANRMADLGAEMAEIKGRLTHEEVYLATDEAYWQLVQALEMHTIAEAYMAMLDEVYRTVGNAVKAGLRTKADLLRVQVEQGKAKLQHERASNAVRLARMNLCQVIGMPLSQELQPTEPLSDEVHLEDLSTGDLSGRPEYALLSKQVELRKAQVRLVRSDFLPQLGLQASYSYMRGLRVNDYLLLDNASPSVAISLNVPIFNWGEGRAKVRAARAELRVSEINLSQMSEKMLLEQQQAQSHYREQMLEVELTRTTLAQAEELLKQTRNRYDAGLDTTAELLEVQTLAVKARGEYTNAKARLALAKTTLLKALGRL